MQKQEPPANTAVCHSLIQYNCATVHQAQLSFFPLTVDTVCHLAFTFKWLLEWEWGSPVVMPVLPTLPSILGDFHCSLRSPVFPLWSQFSCFCPDLWQISSRLINLNMWEKKCRRELNTYFRRPEKNSRFLGKGWKEKGMCLFGFLIDLPSWFSCRSLELQHVDQHHWKAENAWRNLHWVFKRHQKSGNKASEDSHFSGLRRADSCFALKILPIFWTSRLKRVMTQHRMFSLHFNSFL